MTFREFKLLTQAFYYSLISRSYRYNLWQDTSVGFYLRRFEPEIYSNYLAKSYDLHEPKETIQ